MRQCYIPQGELRSKIFECAVMEYLVCSITSREGVNGKSFDLPDQSRQCRVMCQIV
jgi:hypothetical protein